MDEADGTDGNGTDDTHWSADTDADPDLDAILRASRVFIAVVAMSVAEVEDHVTYPQWRILVLVATRGPQTHRAVAADLGVHPSNATRAADRLQGAGLVLREEDPQDRRIQRLRLTDAGRALVSRVMEQRRRALAAVVQRMTPDDRLALARSMSAFADAADEPSTEAAHAALGPAWAPTAPDRGHEAR